MVQADPQVRLTVLGSGENAMLAEIREKFYDPARPPDTYLQISAWNDHLALREVLQSTVLSRIVGAGDEKIDRIDVVGHALLRDGNALGMLMGDSRQVALGLIDGVLRGMDCMDELLQFSRKQVVVRLLLCGGMTLGVATLQAIKSRVAVRRPAARLFSTRHRIAPVAFGPGGFQDVGRFAPDVDLFEI